jgi:hypothetical protein
MAAPRRRTPKKKTTKKTPARRTAKKAPSEKVAAKKNGARPAPVEKQIRGELRYKLKAAHLEWNVENDRIIREAQADIQKLLNKKRRNDPAFKRTNKARIDAYNEVIDNVTPKLPEGFAVKHMDAVEGTFRAEYDPQNRGQHIDV